MVLDVLPQLSLGTGKRHCLEAGIASHYFKTNINLI